MPLKSNVCMRVIDPHPSTASLFQTLKKPVRIALTRESGKNMALYNALDQIYPTLEIVHVPCVETTPATDSENIAPFLKTTETTWVVITSPEAASIFIKAWRESDYPKIGKIAAVGKATAGVLTAVGLEVAFYPSKATGKTLVKEIPPPAAEGETILYPVSAKANTDTVDGLTAKGYSVKRMNTYSTETVTFGKNEQFLAEGTHIVTFASPSAVRGWIDNVRIGTLVSCACIGETSAKAAKEAGFTQIHYPEKPGLDGWIFAVSEALKIYEGIEL